MKPVQYVKHQACFFLGQNSGDVSSLSKGDMPVAQNLLGVASAKTLSALSRRHCRNSEHCSALTSSRTFMRSKFFSSHSSSVCHHPQSFFQAILLHRHVYIHKSPVQVPFFQILLPFSRKRYVQFS